MTIIQPKRVNDFVNSMLAFYDQENQHALPVWTLCSNETGCMIGFNSLPIIADAYAKGFPGYDVKKAHAAMVDSASQTQNYLDDFNQHGYVATRGPDDHDEYKQSVSRTLELPWARRTTPSSTLPLRKFPKRLRSPDEVHARKNEGWRLRHAV